MAYGFLKEKENNNMKSNKTKQMIIISLFAALMCIFSPFTVPLGVIPISLSTLILYLTAVIIDKYAVFSVIVYVLIGAVGLPVFSGGVGGVEKILGPTGGFIIGYIPCALIAGLFVYKFKNKKIMSFLGILVGTIVMYIPGIFWMLNVLGIKTWEAAIPVLAVNIVPFIPIDIFKMFIALFLGLTIKKRIRL